MTLSVPGARDEVQLAREEHPNAKPTRPAVQVVRRAMLGFRRRI
jgi:hypothetical protein